MTHLNFTFNYIIRVRLLSIDRSTAIGSGTLLVGRRRAAVITAFHVVTHAAYAELPNGRQVRIDDHRALFPIGDLAILSVEYPINTIKLHHQKRQTIYISDHADTGTTTTIGFCDREYKYNHDCLKSSIKENIIVHSYSYQTGEKHYLIKDSEFYFLSSQAYFSSSGSSVWINDNTLIGVIHGNSIENDGCAIVISLKNLIKTQISYLQYGLDLDH